MLLILYFIIILIFYSIIEKIFDNFFFIFGVFFNFCAANFFKYFPKDIKNCPSNNMNYNIIVL